MTENERLAAQIFGFAHQIPRGRVLSYGALGAQCDPPVSGYACGRVMAVVDEGVPWWRVVGKDGRLPIRKRNPHLEAQQRALLEAEGVEFDAENRILARFFA